MPRLSLPELVALAGVALIAALAAGHALLTKREPRAALGWIGLVLVFPVAGPVLYYLFGINRIRTRARSLSRGRLLGERPDTLVIDPETGTVETADAITPGDVHRDVPDLYRELARTSAAVTGRPLWPDTRIEPLHDGEGAFPPMIEAIDGARERVVLATYIFETGDDNESGRAFLDALERAAERGVDVKVLVDGVGELYSRPWATKLLLQRGVPARRFLPPRLLPPTLHLNLRNHRKILVADGRVAFTGGINLGDRHLAADRSNPHRVTDVHFRLAGGIAAELERVFLDDWTLAGGDRPEPPPEPLASAASSSPADGEERGSPCLARLIPDGPNEDLDKLVTILVGAVSAARREVLVVTPYFLPSSELVAAFQAAALRGVEVTVVLPEKNNLPVVHWATRNMLWQLLQRGVRVLYQPPPFAHSKLFVVDGHYALVGSANLDPRSLRLNFELGVEVFSEELAGRLGRHVERLIAASAPVTLAELDRRSLPVRLRDAFCWLFQPYL